MSGHTQGPWKLGARYPESHWIDVVSQTDERGLPFVSCKHHDEEANARRIVAAVNATADIPVEALEAGVVAKLVEALEWLEGYLRDTPHHNAPAAANARSALALARGEQA